MERRVTSGDVDFISYLVEVMCELAQTRMQISISELSKVMHTLPPTNPRNLYRKQYGNMDQCLKNGKIGHVFWLDAMMIKPVPLPQLEQARDSGVLSSADFTKLTSKQRDLEERLRAAEARVRGTA